MLGAIIGDIAGSRFEWDNLKSKEFDLLTHSCAPTDDSIMTLAIADALMACGGKKKGLADAAIRSMQTYGRAYPHAGYGGSFLMWIAAEDPKAYNSWGNGSRKLHPPTLRRWKQRLMKKYLIAMASRLRNARL